MTQRQVRPCYSHSILSVHWHIRRSPNTQDTGQDPRHQETPAHAVAFPPQQEAGPRPWPWRQQHKRHQNQPATIPAAGREPSAAAAAAGALSLPEAAAAPAEPARGPNPNPSPGPGPAAPRPPAARRASCAAWRACFGDSDGFTADGGLRIELSQPHHYPVLASLSTQAQAAFAFPPHATPPTRLESLRKAFGAQPQQQQQRH